MVVFQALTWEARDRTEEVENEDGTIENVPIEHLISIFGRTAEGKSVCVTTKFDPYFFVKLKSAEEASMYFKKIKAAFPRLVGFSVITAKDLWGCEFLAAQETTRC